jgi:CheY-like chemotaxis protein
MRRSGEILPCSAAAGLQEIDFAGPLRVECEITNDDRKLWWSEFVNTFGENLTMQNGYSQPETVGRAMEILLVEDNLADARLTIEALREGDFKHRVTLVRDGIEAREFLRRQGKFAQVPRPDLVLLDLYLPGIDGRQLLAEIRADTNLCSIAVVVLTASKSHEDYLQSQSLAVDSYMTKPVDTEQFLDTVRKLKRFWHADVILPAQT